MNKSEAASAFREVALLLELAGELPQHVRAFEHASKVIGLAPDNFDRLACEGRLHHLAGVDARMQQIISEVFRTGTFPLLDQMRRRIPPALSELCAIPGLGPKRIHALHVELGVDSLAALAQACEHNRVALLKGFGLRIQENIQEGIEYVRSLQGARLLNRTYETACRLHDTLARTPGLYRIDIAGSLRRGKELIRNIDLVACAAQPLAVVQHLCSLPEVREVRESNSMGASVSVGLGIPVDLRMAPPEQYVFMLAHYTGNAEHNRELERRAQERGMLLNERGLFRNGQPVPCRDETALYAALGLPYIPPELRENRGEFHAGRMPELVAPRDLRGVVHCHTTYSDGLHSLVEMSSAAQAKGYQYVVISDHSQSAYYANGLQPDQVVEQRREIDLINRTLSGFRIIHGIESDIREDGSLDYTEDVLALLEVVLISVHTKLDMTEAEATRRVVKAIENPYANILAHPTGRLLLSRKGYPLNMDKIFDACVANRTAIEINGNCRRLDLDWRHVHRGKDKGVKFVVCPDAHSTERFDLIPYGVGMARKGWLEKKDVLNCLSAEELIAWCKSKRR